MNFFENLFKNPKENFVEKIDWDVVIITFCGKKYVFEAAKDFAWDNFMSYLKSVQHISKIDKNLLKWYRATLVCSSAGDMFVKDSRNQDFRQGYGQFFRSKELSKAGDFAIHELAKFHWKRLHQKEV